MTHLGYDAAYPIPGGMPGTDTVLIYIGGDTPHVWTPQEIAAQPERFRLPVFVRSFSGVDPTQDGNAAIVWCRSMSVPTGSTVVLDLETLVDPPYVTGFGNDLHAAGYKVLPYGSSSTVMQNPKLDGYYVADPGATAMYPGSVATQFRYAGSYDLSWIDDSVTMWDTQPPPPPPPPPPKQETKMPVSSMITFRANQLDCFQVTNNSLFHKWISVGDALHSEVMGGPLGTNAPGGDPTPTTYPDQVPAVSVINGVCYVNVQDSSTRVHEFAQQQTGPWGHSIFP